MKFLKKIIDLNGVFHARFHSGAITDDRNAACFFTVMQEKGVGLDEVRSYIRIGEKADPSHDWKEIRRIVATFTASRGEAA